jgi:hypothetical protein
MYPGLLSQFGLDLDPAKMKEQDLLLNQQRNLELAGGLGYRGSAAGAAQGGALFAAALANRGYKTPDQDQRKIDTAKQATQLMDAWRAKNPDAKATDASLQYQKFLADSAFRNGLADVGASVMEQYETKRMQREAQQLELKNLGFDSRIKEVQADMAPEEAEHQKWLWGQEEWQDVFPVGANNPNTGKRLKIDSEGNMTDNQGNVIYQAGEYTSIRPQELTSTNGEGVELMMTDSEAGKKREIQTAFVEMIDGVTDVANIIDNATARDGSTDVLGFGGAVAAKSVEIADNMTSTMNNIGKMFGIAPGAVEIEIPGEVGKKGQKKYADLRGSGQKILLEKYGRQVDGVLHAYIPDALRLTGQDAIRIRQNLMNVAYAIMRSKEPGNNRYSDADFKNALELAGQGLADPEKLKATLYDNVNRAARSYDLALAQTAGMHDRIWSAESRELTARKRAEFDKRFGGYAIPTARGVAPVNSGRPVTVTDDEGEWQLSIAP